MRCPRVGCGGEVVYNGNYFCERWGSPYDDACDWALGNVDPDDPHEPAPDPVDLLVWSELRARYGPLRDYLSRHPEEDR